MGLKDVKTAKLLYHLTDIKNLPSIIEHGLLARNEMIKRQLVFTDIANPDIIEKRKLTQLDDYIPFHFHPYSSFDVAVKSTHIDTNFIYLCIRRELARNKHFYILPRHPLSEKDCILLPYEEGFNAINWDIMCKTQNELEQEHIDAHLARMIKMAECLVPNVLNFNDIWSIYVKNEQTKQRIIDFFNHLHMNNSPYVNVTRNWFR